MTESVISEKPWSGSASRFTDEQWKASCILHLADTLNKSDHKLPIKEPGGALSRAGVHAAASRFGSTDGPPEAKASAKASLRGAYKTLGEEPPDNLKAALDWERFKEDGQIIEWMTEALADSPQKKAAEDKNTAVVLLPKKDHPVHKVGDEQKHVTIAHMKGVEDPGPIHEHVKKIASTTSDHAVAHVSGKGQLGPDAAKVWLLESHDINALHKQVTDHPDVQTGMDHPGQHAGFIPHMTATYGDEPEGMDDQDEIPFDRLAVWHGDDQQEYPLGGSMKPDEKKPTEPDAPVDQPAEREDPPSDQVPDGDKIPDKAKRKTSEGRFSAVPIHGVLAPEDVWSGDKRKFNKDSLSNRPVPLPFTWQKVSAAGHDGNVVVAKMEKIGKLADGRQVMGGHMLTSMPEADEFVGLLAEFGRFGISVDADKVVFDLEGSGEEGVAFAEARTSSACAVAIPAFAEAWVALGEPPEEWGLGEVEEVPDEALVASITAAGLNMGGDMLQQLRRGPGWVTNPEDTRRLWNYWVHGEGAAKIGWGTHEGDFYTCKTLVGEKIAANSPEDMRFINNICAQWHHDALGRWPGQEAKAADTLELSDTEMAPAVTITAGAARVAKAAWFHKQPADKMVPFTVDDDGSCYGYIATFGTCHIGFSDVCVTPPTDDDFAWFHGGGQVALDDGTRANTGVISLGGGHAGPHKSMRAAIAHYDSTSTAVADVTASNGPLGIWVCGRVRPGCTDEQVTALMASKVSGDWRNDGGKLALCAVLSVNVAGFPVPRVAASNGVQESLVAAGVVTDEPASQGVSVEQLAVEVAAELARQEERKKTMAALAARLEEVPSGV